MRKCAFLFVSVLLLTGGCGGTDKPRFSKEELARMPFPQRSGLPECSGGFVLSVGGETITSDEIIGSIIRRKGVFVPLIESLRPIAQKNDREQFKEQARPQVEQVINSKLSRILLYQRAKEQAGEGVDEALEKLAEEEIRIRFGRDDTKVNAALKQMGMNRQNYKEYLKMMILNQSYRVSRIRDNRPITYSELLKCYNEMKDEFVQPAVIKFRLIDIKVAELEVSDPNQDRRQLARDLANELVGRIRAGEDIGELYEKYSGMSFAEVSKSVQLRRAPGYEPEGQDAQAISDSTEAIEMNPGDANAYSNRGNAYRAKRRYGAPVMGAALGGGQVGFVDRAEKKKNSWLSFVDHSGGVQPNNLGEPYDILVAVAEKIEPGQVPEPIETRTGEHIFIMKFDGEQPKSFKPLRDVQREVKKKIISDRRQKAMDELEAELLRQAPLGEKDAFINFCLEKIYRMVNEKRQK